MLVSPAVAISTFLVRFAGGGLGVVAEEDGPDGEVTFAAVAGRPRFLASEVSILESGDLRCITLPLLDLTVPDDVPAAGCFGSSTQRSSCSSDGSAMEPSSSPSSASIALLNSSKVESKSAAGIAVRVLVTRSRFKAEL